MKAHASNTLTEDSRALSQKSRQLRCWWMPALMAIHPCIITRTCVVVTKCRMCRERFLLTNEAALKSHIAEFLDHQLIATRWAGLLL